MKRFLSIFLLGFTVTSTLDAQNQIDALRYSNLNYSGTARFNAMGGAFTALGGDFSSITLNPASVGIYRSSELTFSPGFLFTSNSANFYGNNTDNGRLNFNIGNIGYVGHSKQDHNGWKGLNFAIGYNRTNSFNREYNFRSGFQDNESLIDTYVDELNSYNTYNSMGEYTGGISPSDIYSLNPSDIGMAYDTYLVDLLDSASGGGYDVRFYDAYGGISKSFNVIEKGGMGDLGISVGANYEDKLYIGAAVAFTIVNFNQQTTYKEKMNYTTPIDSANQAAGFYRVNDYTRRTSLDVNGTGINLKFGLIYKPIEMIRLGASIQSPTYLALDDTYSTSFSSNMSNGEEFSVESLGEFSYRINTPWRTNAGVGFILGKKAIISADYEYVNYPKAKLKDALDATDSYGFDDENVNINNDFSKAHNVRLGLEYRINPPYSVRAGFKYNDNPLNTNFSENLSSKTFSGGIGYKDEKGYFIDLAYSLRKYSETQNLQGITNLASLKQNSHLIQFTVGLKY